MKRSATVVASLGVCDGAPPRAPQRPGDGLWIPPHHGRLRCAPPVNDCHSAAVHWACGGFAGRSVRCGGDLPSDRLFAAPRACTTPPRRLILLPSLVAAPVCVPLCVCLRRRSTVSELCNVLTQSAVPAGGLHLNRVDLCRACDLCAGGSCCDPQVWRADSDDCDVDGILELRAQRLVHYHSSSATNLDQHRAVWRRKLLRVLSHVCSRLHRALLQCGARARLVWAVPADYDRCCACRFSTRHRGRFWRRIVTTAIEACIQGYSWRSIKAARCPGTCCQYSSRLLLPQVLGRHQHLMDSRNSTTRTVSLHAHMRPLPCMRRNSPTCVPGGPGTTWRDRVNLGWAGQTSEFFIALAVMCFAGTCALCIIQPPPAHTTIQGESATLSPRNSALGASHSLDQETRSPYLD